MARNGAYILVTARVGVKVVYMPEHFPHRASKKQIFAVCREHLDFEVPDWQEATLDFMYYDIHDYNIKNIQHHIKK